MIADTPPPLVYVLVLNWNNWRDTNECLASLRCLSYRNYCLLVIDNGSGNDSVLRIRERFPEAQLLELGDNLGFAGGNNAGIRMALDRGAQYVWLLNSDTKVDPHALTALVEKAEADSDIGAVGSVLFFMDRPNQIQAWGGGRVDFRLGRSKVFSVPVDDAQLQYIGGASLLISRDALLKVGLLDEVFFMYWEDTDYCFRLRKAGMLLAVASESRVFHKGSASFEGGSVLLDTYFTRSSSLFFRKHAIFPGVPFWMGVVLRAAKRAASGKWSNLYAVWSEAKRTTGGVSAVGVRDSS